MPRSRRVTLGVTRRKTHCSGAPAATAAVPGTLVDNLIAGRISAITTGRNGVIRDVTTGKDVNDVNNSAFRAQLLYTPSSVLKVRFIGDYSSVYTDCCTQVYFTVGTSLKPAARQYAALAAGGGYAP